MNTIVLNTLTGAVSEYEGFDFHAITPDHAGSALGLYAFGGDLDVAVPIIAWVATGLKEWGSSLKKLGSTVYFAMQGSGAGELTVGTPAASYAYPFPVSPTGQSRCVVGRGIRENYLAYSYRNPGGEGFRIDAIEVLTESSPTRRI